MQDDAECFRELGPSGRTLNPTIPCGIDTLPIQQVNLEMRRGFSFNILCLGETGIGKTKLLEALFKKSFHHEPHFKRSDTVSYRESSYHLSEGNVDLNLTLIESIGFGDQINKNNSSQSINTYLDSQFDSYMNEEMKSKRSIDKFKDTRVHVCLYVISPTGHSLKSWDVLTMKELDSRVNIIPVIGKADILTKSELTEFKQKVLEEIKESGIKIYQFPTDDPNIAAKNTEMNDRLPFAVVASVEEEMINQKLCRVRKYPWGTVVVDDNMHCEFQYLREMLLKESLYDLIKATHERHYENYRSSKLSVAGFSSELDVGESIKKKKNELIEKTEKEIEALRLKCEKDIKEVQEETKIKKAELSAKYTISNNSLPDEKKLDASSHRSLKFRSLLKKRDKDV